MTPHTPTPVANGGAPASCRCLLCTDAPPETMPPLDATARFLAATAAFAQQAASYAAFDAAQPAQVQP